MSGRSPNRWEERVREHPRGSDHRGLLQPVAEISPAGRQGVIPAPDAEPDAPAPHSAAALPSSDPEKAP